MAATAGADEPPVFLGSRVRVETAQGSLVGNLLAWEAGSVSLINTGRGDPYVVGAESIQRLELSRGRRRPVLKSALVGAAIGAAVYGLMPLESPCEPGAQPSFSGCETHGAWAQAGAWVGAVVGATVGVARKVDRWQEVPLSRVRVGIAPVPGGAAAAMTITH